MLQELYRFQSGLADTGYKGDTASELVSLRVHASAMCAACIAVAPEDAVASLRVALVM